MTSPRLAAVLAALVVALAACSGGGATAAPSVAPSASGAACATTPEPAPDTVSAWQGGQAPSIEAQMAARMRNTPVVCVRVKLDQPDGLFPGLSAVVGIRKKKG